MKGIKTIDASDEARLWLKALITAGLMLALMSWYQHIFASDGVEFEEATQKFESWVKGGLGKLAALGCLAMGSIVAAVKKDWSWFFGSVILALGIGIVVGIVDASFTATI